MKITRRTASWVIDMNQHILRPASRCWRVAKWLENLALLAIIAGSIWMFVTDDADSAAGNARAPSDVALRPGGELIPDTQKPPNTSLLAGRSGKP